jgi:hypothetical protein
MPDQARIFICYKKRGSDGRENNSAYQLYQFLSEVPHYHVWMDEGLDAGLLWEKTISVMSAATWMGQDSRKLCR